MVWHDLLGNVIALAGIMGVNFAAGMLDQNFGRMITDRNLRAAIMGGLKDFLTISVYKIFANVPHLQI